MAFRTQAPSQYSPYCVSYAGEYFGSSKPDKDVSLTVVLGLPTCVWYGFYDSQLFEFRRRMSWGFIFIGFGTAPGLALLLPRQGDLPRRSQKENEETFQISSSLGSLHSEWGDEYNRICKDMPCFAGRELYMYMYMDIHVLYKACTELPFRYPCTIHVLRKYMGQQEVTRMTVAN